MKARRLTDRELDIMSVLWRDGPSTVAEVRARVDQSLAYTTILNMLRLMELKGYVGHEKEGRAHRFRALISTDAVRRNALDRVVQKVYQGSPLKLLAHLVADETLDEKELKRMRQLLDDRLDRGIDE